MIHHNRKLIVMVGNIGSGKTTSVNYFVNTGYAVVSLDAYRYMLGNGTYVFNKKLERSLFVGQEKLVNELMKTGANIVIDETNVARKTRARYIKLAKKYNYRATAVVMPRFSLKTSVDHRMIDPHGQNDRTLWETIWLRFNHIYEEPTKAEGFVKVVKMRGE